MASDKGVMADSQLRRERGILEIGDEIPIHTSSRDTPGNCTGPRFMFHLNFVYFSNVLKSFVSSVSALAS